ncbi:dihydrolipoamide acetyltransferase family protein [Legionella sp. W05-934-2]|jgi:pyruvate dehydrogenase E2 component (dihydrolipoamide acetyltransferase)|uniref:dihydrolipoamide acetyltransferase family protein n=1 Tax=Legionella sp. W05-934-2 TaxID=1198649 RepID=UPI003461C0E5
MKEFKLPDLGEGLPDAEIHEWFVKVGDVVKVDQPLVSMETAKAVVDVPSPQDGVIEKLFGQPGDVIKTGQPLVGFTQQVSERKDQGTVVGNLEELADVGEDNFIIGSAQTSKRIKVSPAIKLLAKKLGVDLNNIKGSGEQGRITREDVEKKHAQSQTIPEGFEALKGVRRAMLASMEQSHQEIVPVSIYDEADIHAWSGQQDITVRLIRALAKACQAEPALNAWYNTQHKARRCFDKMHLGIAMDSAEGLFVPVITDAGNQTDQVLRETINRYKKQVAERNIPAENLKGATITLSNFGKFSGKFASPIIVPPMVAILAVGRLHEAAIAKDGKINAHPVLPLSLTFDHRAITGGEATRFLGAVIQALQAAS